MDFHPMRSRFFSEGAMSDMGNANFSLPRVSSPPVQPAPMAVAAPAVETETENPDDVHIGKMNELNEVSVMDYFALSDMYDNTCLTSVFDMQSKYFSGKMDKRYLKNMEGVDYEVTHRQGNRLFVIDKVRRQKDPRDGQVRQTTMSVYYILDGWVYLCPSVSKLIDSKIQMISHFIRRSLQAVSDKHTFSVARGHQVSESTSAEEEARKPCPVYAHGASPQAKPVNEKLSNGRYLEKMMLENLYQKMQKQAQQAAASVAKTGVPSGHMPGSSGPAPGAQTPTAAAQQQLTSADAATLQAKRAAEAAAAMPNAKKKR